MAKCDTCGNEYRDAFQVVLDGKTHTFDCFACAIQLLAPACTHCGCVILGHGLEHNGDYFCCNHCVREFVSPSRDGSIGGPGRSSSLAGSDRS